MYEVPLEMLTEAINLDVEQLFHSLYIAVSLVLLHFVLFHLLVPMLKNYHGLQFLSRPVIVE